MSELRCIVVTPEKTLRDTSAEFVAIALFDGEVGIAPKHSPMIGRLGCGEMRITDAGRTARYYIEGGFVEVLHNTVSVLTSRAVPAEELDDAVALDQLESARSRAANTPELMALRDRAVDQAGRNIASPVGRTSRGKPMGGTSLSLGEGRGDLSGDSTTPFA